MNRITILISLFVVGLSACTKKNVEEMRKEQDTRILTERAVVISEAKAKYESSPDDPVAEYLYARVTDDPDVAAKLTSDLVKKHPDFAWGQFLLADRLRKSGDYEASTAALKRAAELAPSIKDISEGLAEQRDSYVVLDAFDMSSIMGRLVTVLTTGKSPIALDQRDPTLDLYEHFSGQKKTRFKGVTMMSYFRPATSEQTGVYVYIRNTSDSTINLDGDDVKADRAVACFTKSGAKIGPKVDFIFDNDSKDCRSCPATDITIAPGDSKAPYAVFDADANSLKRCVFYNLPRRGNTVVVSFPSK